MSGVAGATPVTFDRRIQAGRSVTLRWAYTDADGYPADAPAVPTVAITDVAGNAVTVGSVSTADGSTEDQAAEYTATVAADDNASPDLWDVVWTSAGETFAEHLEIVGAFYISISQLRKDRPGSRSRTVEISDARTIAEREVERVTGTRFSPAARKVRIRCHPRHRSSLLVPDSYIRAVRSVTDENGDTFDAAALANLDPSGSGFIHRTDGTPWPTSGWLDLVYEYGLDTRPPEVVEATIRRTEFWQSRERSDVPAWATSYTVDGLNATFRTADGTRWRTGDSTVDALLSGWAARAHAPAIG